MDIVLQIINYTAAVGLLVFGGVIVYRGISVIVTKYDWKAKDQADANSANIRAASSGEEARSLGVQGMLASLNKIVEQVAAEPTRNEGDADTGSGEADAGAQASEADDKTSLLEGVATIIEKLPSLLNADFGPMVWVSFVGLLIMSGGFYLLVSVLNAG